MHGMTYGKSMARRVQLSRKAGWRMPPNTVSVARPGRWGNPFYVSRWRDARTCVALFENSMQGVWNPATSAHLPQAWQGYDEHTSWLARMKPHPLDLLCELRGKNLACWCSLDQPCHADVLLCLANNWPSKSFMNIVNATPPYDFPAQVIVAQDTWFAAAHPEAGYWLRISTDADEVMAILLPGAVCPAHARRLARLMGYEPTHYTDPGDGRPWLF